MALSAAGLKAAIESEMAAEFGAPQDATQQSKFAQAVATAVIDYLKANTVVNIPSVSGVTPGGGASGPGTGTVT